MGRLCDTRVMLQLGPDLLAGMAVCSTYTAVPFARLGSDRPISACNRSFCEFDASTVQGKALVMHWGAKPTSQFNAASAEP